MDEGNESPAEEEEDTVLGAMGGKPTSLLGEAEAELERVTALASSTAFANPNGVTQRRVRETAGGGSSDMDFNSPQKQGYLEERVAAMETTLSVMSRLMERLAPLLEEQPPRTESPWDASTGSSQILGARRKTQAAPNEGGDGPSRGVTITPQPLPMGTGAGRGAGRIEAPFGQPAPPVGMMQAGTQGMQFQPLQQRREDLRAEFGGKPEDLDFFLTLVRGYLEDNAHTFRSEASRVRIVGAALRGGAASWYVQLHARHDPCLGSVRAFLAALEARFRDPLERIKARDKLRTITQGQRSVSEFAEEFQMLAERVPDWSAQTKVEIFKEGLRKELLTWALHRDDPGTIQGWIQLAGRVETTLSQIERHRGTTITSRPQRREDRKPSGEPPKKEPASREKSRQTGCYVCGRPGHRASACWQRKGGDLSRPIPKPVAGRKAEECSLPESLKGTLEEEVEEEVMSGSSFRSPDFGAEN
ncbi:retrotransposon-derived protein PEG10 [Anolis sagrei]|uniref:retrotransposon-derived protein PEG10 n=1 Tax=Anolis sagrei TaxID=38937 RepID=UPI0035201E8F